MFNTFGFDTNFFTPDFLETFMRWFVAFVILACAGDLLYSSWLIRNRRLTLLLYKIGFGLLCFFASRVVAGALDAYFNFEFRLASYLVNDAFWLIVYLNCRKIRVQVKRIDAKGRTSIADSLDTIYEEMTLARARHATFG